MSIQNKVVKNTMEMTRLEFAEKIRKTQRMVYPIGSVEQHGPHLPLGTDFMSGVGMGRELARKMDCFLAAACPYGVTPYQTPWPGTVTLTQETMVTLLLEIWGEYYRNGIREMVLVIGHEGDILPSKVAADEAQRKFPGMRFIITEPYRNVHNLFPEFSMDHANHQEALQVMFYDMDYVVDTALCDNPSSTKTAQDEHERYRRNDIYPVMRDFREVCPSGYYGVMGQPTVEEAKHILDVITDDCIEFINEFFEHNKTAFAVGTPENQAVLAKEEDRVDKAVYKAWG